MNSEVKAIRSYSGVIPSALNPGVVAGFALTRELQDMMVITGASGTGKTCAARYYQQTTRGVWLVTMTPASANLACCLSRVARAVGIEDEPHRVARLEEAIVSRALGTGGLLIVDEAQHLHMAALEGLCRLQDQAQIGIVIMGGETFAARLTNWTWRTCTPIGRFLALKLPEEGDVTRLLAAWDVPYGVMELCHWISRQRGALHALKSILRAAMFMADNEEQELTESHIKAAWCDLRERA